MRAVVCQETELTVEEVPDPTPGPGHVLLKVVRAGICGSDLHARHHGDDVAEAAEKIGVHDIMRRSDRVVMGHEFSGEVVSYGPHTRRRWPVGTPVVSLPMIRHHGVVRMTGLSARAPGAYAEYVLADEALTMPVPESLDPALAAMTEPLAVAHHAVRKSRIGKRETAVVVGCGPIGLAVILMLKAGGVRHVVASDFSARRRELATRCGADVVVDPAATSPWAGFEGSRKYWTDGSKLLDMALGSVEKLRRVDPVPWARVLRAAEKVGATPAGPVVFECVGVPGIVSDIIDRAPLYTRVVVVGVCMEPDTLHPSMAINKEISLQYVFAYDPGEFHDALQMLGRGAVDPRPLHTGTVGLDGVPAAFDDLAGAEQHAKVLVDPWQRPV